MHGKKEKEEEEEYKGGYLMDTSSSNKRQRFFIDIKPDQTAFVSWKKLLNDNSKVGQRNNSFLKDEKLGRRVKSSDDKQILASNIEFPKVEAKINDKLEDSKIAYRLAVENAQSRLQKYLRRSDTSSFVGDCNLEGLHDVPVMYSRRTSTILNHSSVNVADDTSLFPLETKRNFLQNTQKLCSEKSRMYMKAENCPSDITSRGSARVFGPLRTYQRSRNFANGRLSKAHSMLHNDKLVGLTAKTNATQNTDIFPFLKRKVTNTCDRHVLGPSPCHKVAQKNVAVKGLSLLPNSSHYAKSILFKPSREQPFSKEPNMEVPGKNKR